jgi:dTDP-4-dehydrorhamnose 3,5-epimerase
LIRVLEGAILDVVLDLRLGSPTYGKVYTLELSALNKKQLLVPKGFAHGYSVLSDTAEVFYKCDEFYNKQAEGGIAYNDPELQINWMVPDEKMLLSAKDRQHPNMANGIQNFKYQD